MTSDLSDQDKHVLIKLISELDQNDVQNNPAHAIVLCEQVLALLSRDFDPELWASIQQTLGNSLCKSKHGDIRNNQQRAFRAFNNALEVRSPDSSPVDWASTMNSLGNLWLDRIEGQPVANIETAMNCYNRALTVRRKATLPHAWATTMNNLGNAYRKLWELTRQDVLDDAIHCYVAALEVRNSTSTPLEWAKTLSNLGLTLLNSVTGTGDKASERIKQAKACLAGALSVRHQRECPVEFAETVGFLAKAFLMQNHTNRSQNIRRAVKCHHAAINALDPAKHPIQWASAKANLSITIDEDYELPIAERQALVAQQLDESLDIIDRQITPARWANIAELRAIAFINTPTGNRTKNIEQALSLLKDCEQIYTRDDFPVDWAHIMVNAASAYLEYPTGDRIQHIQHAVERCTSALTILNAKSSLNEWARAKINLGIAYARQIGSQKKEYILRAIDLYNDVLTKINDQHHPQIWADVNFNLANAYLSLPRYTRKERIRDAISLLQLVLDVQTRKTMPYHWAEIMNSLGVAHEIGAGIIPECTPEKAISYFKAALEIRSHENLPHEWASTMHNLGCALAATKSGNVQENIANAIEAFEKALTIRQRDTNPFDHLLTLNVLANLCFEVHKWQEAYTHYASIITVGLKVFKQAQTAAGQNLEIGEIADPFKNASYCLIKLDRLEDGLLLLDEGKARLQVTTFQQFVEQGKTEDGSFEVADIDNIRLGLDEIANIIPVDTALVIPVFSSEGSAIFVLPHGFESIREHVIHVDTLSLDQIGELLQGAADDPQFGGWLGSYLGYRTSNNLPRWKQDIAAFTRQLWELFIGVIYEKLKTIRVKNVIFVPQGGTQLLPLHAAWRYEDSSPRYLVDDFAISYIPSLYALKRSHKSNNTYIAPVQDVIVGVSQYTNLSPLRFTELEADVCAKMLNTKPLINQQARTTTIKQMSTNARYLHFACHGTFAWTDDDPLASCLFIGADDVFHLSEIAQLQLKHCRLVTLSACETGVIDVRRPTDEAVGLSNGFLHAGAIAVMSSLWIVDDESTFLLVQEFYRKLIDGSTPRDALQSAQMVLRGQTASVFQNDRFGKISSDNFQQDSPIIDTDFNHPYYWAGFYLTGI